MVVEILLDAWLASKLPKRRRAINYLRSDFASVGAAAPGFESADDRGAAPNRGRAKAQAISTLPWKPCAQVWPTPTCIRPTSAEVRFAARSAGARDMIEVVSDP